MNKVKIFTLLFGLVFPFSVLSQESVPIKLKTSKGCEYFIFLNPANNTSKYKSNFESNWDGNCSGGLVNGKGVLSFLNKNSGVQGFLDGTFTSGYRNGFGNDIYFYEWGTREYKGILNQGRWNEGTLTEINKTSGISVIKSGTFRNGKLTGYGMVTYSKNNNPFRKFTGTFKDGKLNGEGTQLEIAENISWTGNFTDDKKNGVGYTTFPDGTRDWLAYENDEIPNVGTGDGSPAHYYCAERGLRPGTSIYAKCRNYYLEMSDIQKRMDESLRNFERNMRRQ